MEIRLLPAPVDSSDSSDVTAASTSLVPYDHGAVATRASTPSDIVRSADTYVWPASAGRGGANRIYGTPVEDSHSEDASGETGESIWEYVSGWAWSRPIELTAVAQYLRSAAKSISGNGLLIDVYA
jgi:hypothetical protein